MEAAIGRAFYKDEADAVRYYTERMRRKKELGAEYNEVFLDAALPDRSQEPLDIEDESR